jgi:multiple sugar transport system permease protein
LVKGIHPQKRFVLFSLTPILAVFAAIFVFPVFSALYISFTNWKMLGKNHKFIYFENYINLFKDDLFTVSFSNTIYFTVIYLILTFVVGLGIALLINQIKNSFFKSTLKIVVFLPVITLTVAACLIWQWMYVPGLGIINYLLSLVNLGPFLFLASSSSAILSVVYVTTWKWVGINIIIFLAGLNSIPKEYYEAANIDGAGKKDIFLKITLPLLTPTIEYVCVTTIVAGVQIFTEIFILTSGGPGTASRLLSLHIFEVGFKYLRMGQASAVAFVLFSFILLLTALQLRFFKKGNAYN